MRRIIIFCCFILLACYLNAEVSKPESENENIKNTQLILGSTFGISYGFGKSIPFPSSVKEVTTNIHFRANNDYYAAGIFGQIKWYYNKLGTGFFWITTAGADYARGKYKPFVFDPGGPEEDDFKMEKFAGIHPNFTLGCGLSFHLFSNSRLQVYCDLGIKKGIANIFISYVF